MGLIPGWYQYLMQHRYFQPNIDSDISNCCWQFWLSFIIKSLRFPTNRLLKYSLLLLDSRRNHWLIIFKRNTGYGPSFEMPTCLSPTHFHLKILIWEKSMQENTKSMWFDAPFETSTVKYRYFRYRFYPSYRFTSHFLPLQLVGPIWRWPPGRNYSW